MRYFFLSTLSAFALSAAPLVERIQGAQSGDYIVFEAGKTVTLLAIRSIDRNRLVLEEISAPSQSLKEMPISWSDWVRKNAPGHTSWSMIEIDLNQNKVLECYSFSKSAWVSEEQGLMSTLLNLPLFPVNASDCRKIGPPPQPGEPDLRKQWNPPLVVEGKKLEKALFDVFETFWPQDGSELAGKKVAVYLDRENHSALPYWIQVETAHATASVRAIDSGKRLSTVHRSIPRRIPQFVGAEQKTGKGLRLTLKSPRYYTDFELYAVEKTGREQIISPILHTVERGDGEVLWIDIDRKELSQVLQPDHSYTWLVVPLGHSESYTKSHKPFLWKID